MVTPIFKLKINQQEIEEIVSIEYNDRIEDHADNLIVEFDEGATNSFKEDDTVECWLGYIESGLYYVGSFVVNEVLNKKFTTAISATALDFSLSLQEKKNRSFTNGFKP